MTQATTKNETNHPLQDRDRSLFGVVNLLLKEPLRLVRHFQDESASDVSWNLAKAAILCLALFSVVVGSFSGGAQYWSAPLKIVGGIAFSSLICLPSLYIFSSLSGVEARIDTIVGILCAHIALTALLLVGFAPVVWLFSVSGDSVGFMGALLILLWLISAGFGLVLVHRASLEMGMAGSRPMLLWSVVFLLVTLQMPTTLRPIVGSDSAFLRLDEKMFFLDHWKQELREPGMREPEKDW